MDESELRQRLLDLRTGVINHLASARADLVNLRDGAGELSTLDNHPADVATDVYDRGRAAGTVTHALARLAAIDAALDRVADGSYGRCESCGKPIDPNRLEAMPEAARCRACAADREDWRRPPEQDGMADTVADMVGDERGGTGRRLTELLEDFGSAAGPGGEGERG